MKSILLKEKTAGAFCKVGQCKPNGSPGCQPDGQQPLPSFLFSSGLSAKPTEYVGHSPMTCVLLEFTIAAHSQWVGPAKTSDSGYTPHEVMKELQDSCEEGIVSQQIVSNCFTTSLICSKLELLFLRGRLGHNPAEVIIFQFSSNIYSENLSLSFLDPLTMSLLWTFLKLKKQTNIYIHTTWVQQSWWLITFLHTTPLTACLLHFIFPDLSYISFMFLEGSGPVGDQYFPALKKSHLRKWHSHMSRRLYLFFLHVGFGEKGLFPFWDSWPMFLSLSMYLFPLAAVTN